MGFCRPFLECAGSATRSRTSAGQRSTDNEIFGTSFSAGLPGSKKHERSYVSLSSVDLEQAHQSFARVADELSDILGLIREIDEDAAIRVYLRSGA